MRLERFINTLIPVDFSTALLDSRKDVEDENPVDMSPKFCHVSTTSDGSEHIVRKSV